MLLMSDPTCHTHSAGSFRTWRPNSSRCQLCEWPCSSCHKMHCLHGVHKNTVLSTHTISKQATSEPPSLQEEARQTLEAFREFFQDPRIHKAWHNYSFDRHVMFNTHQVDCQGLAGDTVHMARLWSSSRKGKLNYSLESLSRWACCCQLQCLVVARLLPLFRGWRLRRLQAGVSCTRQCKASSWVRSCDLGCLVQAHCCECW